MNCHTGKGRPYWPCLISTASNEDHGNLVFNQDLAIRHLSSIRKGKAVLGRFQCLLTKRSHKVLPGDNCSTPPPLPMVSGVLQGLHLVPQAVSQVLGVANTLMCLVLSFLPSDLKLAAGALSQGLGNSNRLDEANKLKQNSYMIEC